MTTTKLKLAAQIGKILKEHQFKLVTVESCTGGLLAETITAIAGSSSCFDCGLITYSNESKTDLAKVDTNILQQHGAVSAATVEAMVKGGLRNSNGRAQVGVAITGIAGPSGGSSEKPIGTVYFAWKILNEPVVVMCKHFDGNRDAIRLQSVQFALEQLVTLLHAFKP